MNDLVKTLLNGGHDLKQIAEFLCDGAALLEKGIIDQDLVDEAYSLVQKLIKDEG